MRNHGSHGNHAASPRDVIRPLKNAVCRVGLHVRSLRRPEGRLIRPGLGALQPTVFEQSDGLRYFSSLLCPAALGIIHDAVEHCPEDPCRALPVPARFWPVAPRLAGRAQHWPMKSSADFVPWFALRFECLERRASAVDNRGPCACPGSNRADSAVQGQGGIGDVIGDRFRDAPR